jgi:hypothetical protein
MWVKWLTLVYFEMVLISASVGAWFAPNVPWEQKSFWPHLMDLLGDVGKMEAHFGLFEDSVNLHVRCCTVCAIGLNINLGAPDGTPR